MVARSVTRKSLCRTERARVTRHARPVSLSTNVHRAAYPFAATEAKREFSTKVRDGLLERKACASQPQRTVLQGWDVVQPWIAL
jgi:hypothetical protein